MKTLKTLFAIAAASLSLAPGAASALSCIQPSLERSVNSWIDSPDSYYIGMGSLTALLLLPEIPGVGEPPVPGVERNLSAPFRFDGHFVHLGDIIPTSREVMVRVECAGPWCGAFPPQGKRMLMPLRVLPDQTLELTVGPCPGDLFTENLDYAEEAIRNCLTLGRCPEPVE